MEIEFDPYKKLSFKSYIPYESHEALIEAMCMGAPAGIPGRATLFWANGVLFRFFTFPPSEAAGKEYVSGNLVWDHIEFAPMATYIKEIQGPKDRPMFTIYVLDVSKHTTFGPLTKWIRDNLLKT
jgi:hypothetical protein